MWNFPIPFEKFPLAVSVLPTEVKGHGQLHNIFLWRVLVYSPLQQSKTWSLMKKEITWTHLDKLVYLYVGTV